MQIVPLPDMKQMIGVLPAVRPTMFGAVPQVWYKLKAGIEAQLAAEKSPVKRRLAHWAIEVGRRRARLLSDRTPGAARAGRAACRRRSARAVGCARSWAWTACASPPPARPRSTRTRWSSCSRWAAVLRDVGHVRADVRGDDEPAGRDPYRHRRQGALDGVELMLAEDGELLVRGPLVMKGYRNEPEKTAETVDADGWLHTGDVATIDADGYVRIVDRKKELMINAAGKNMSPANIEGAVKVACPLVGSAVAIGDDRPYVVALLTLDPDAAAAFAAAHGLADTSPQALAADPAVRAAIEAGIEEANQRLARVEQIKRFEILPEVWEPGGDEITPTMKIKRKPIAASTPTGSTRCTPAPESRGPRPVRVGKTGE